MPDEFEIEAPAFDAAKNPALRGVTTDRGSGVVGVNHKKKSFGLLGGSDMVRVSNKESLGILLIIPEQGYTATA